MARIRTIKPEFPQSESMGRVSRDARLLFILLWTVADDEGRLRENPHVIRGALFPYEQDSVIPMITSWLDELANEGAITRHEGAIHINDWDNLQSIDRPKSSWTKRSIDSRAAAIADHVYRYKKAQVSNSKRNRVFERDGWKCLACGNRDDLTVDHVVPESKGGTHDDSNLQTLCKSCNSRKGTKTIDHRTAVQS
jgi:5-methylcytosine-specific restriction endonuclease McrA